MNYRAEIDGLRAVAVLPVILFHAGFSLFSGGFVGVDIFFVISGYLITTILIEDAAKGRFSLLRFYERRARRILPALFFVMLVCLPFAWAWMLPSQMKAFSESLAAVSLFVSNILFWFESGYFAAAAEEKPLLHTWSLAVEEQYYLIFPVLLIAAWRLGRDRVFWMIAVLALASLALSEWGWRHAPSANFYLIPTRAWELFAGSLSAFIVHRRGVRANNLLATAGLAALVFAIFAFDEHTPFPSLYALVPVGGVVLLILFAGAETWAARALSLRWVVALGLISYSAYLWHQPLFAFARIRTIEEPSGTLMLALSGAALVLAALSWRFVEQPFRGPASFLKKRWQVFTLSLLGMAFFIGMALVIDQNDGFRGRFDRLVAGDVNHEIIHRAIGTTYPVCEAEAIAARAVTANGFLRCRQSRPGAVDWVLLGDSHAEHLFLGLAEQRPDKNTAYYTMAGKPYVDAPEFAHIFAELTADQPPKTIFLTFHYLARVDRVGELYAGFTKTVRTLQSAGHEVIMLGDIPKHKVHPEDCLYAADIALATRYCSTSAADFDRQLEVFDPILTQLATETGARYIPLHAPLCGPETCHMILGDTIYYRDKNHLNIPGTRLIAVYLDGQL